MDCPHRSRRHDGLPPRHVGPWRIDPADIGKHDHLLLETDEGHGSSLQRPARFGSVDLVPTSARRWPAFAALGPEPLDGRIDGNGSRRASRADRSREAAAARPADRCRAGQYLCLRGAVPGPDRSAQAGGQGQPGQARCAGRGDRRCSTKRSSRRLDPEGFRRAGWRARLFLQAVRRLRPRRRAVPRLRGEGQAHRPGRTVDLLLPSPPASASATG